MALQDQWYRRAELAMEKREESLARDALRRKKSFSDTAAMLKKQLDQHTRASSQLMTNIRYSKDRIKGVEGSLRGLGGSLMGFLISTDSLCLCQSLNCHSWLQIVLSVQ